MLFMLFMSLVSILISAGFLTGVIVVGFRLCKQPVNAEVLFKVLVVAILIISIGSALL